MSQLIRVLNRDTNELLEIHYNTPELFPEKDLYILSGNDFLELTSFLENYLIPEVDQVIQKSNN